MGTKIESRHNTEILFWCKCILLGRTPNVIHNVSPFKKEKKLQELDKSVSCYILLGNLRQHVKNKILFFSLLKKARVGFCVCEKWNQVNQSTPLKISEVVGIWYHFPVPKEVKVILWLKLHECSRSNWGSLKFFLIPNWCMNSWHLRKTGIDQISNCTLEHNGFYWAMMNVIN